MTHRANPVEVEAHIIICVGAARPDGAIPCATGDGHNRRATREMCSRFIPQAGDYWVIQADGYEYVNPKDVFERKYSPIAP